LFHRASSKNKTAREDQGVIPSLAEILARLLTTRLAPFLGDGWVVKAAALPVPTARREGAETLAMAGLVWKRKNFPASHQ
jgi:hypothetical protein